LNNDPRLQIIVDRRQRQRARQGKGQTFIRAAAIGLISIVVAIGLFFSLTVGGAVAAYLSLTANLPDPAQIEAQFTNQNQDFFETTKIYDRTGKNLLYEVIDERTGDRQWVALDQIPELCRQATIANEDRSFYENPGFDLRGMGRALMSNLQGGQVQGGSSITQQVVKNTLIESEQRLVQDRIKNFLTRYLPTAMELTDAEVAEVSGLIVMEPGDTPLPLLNWARRAVRQPRLPSRLKAAVVQVNGQIDLDDRTWREHPLLKDWSGKKQKSSPMQGWLINR